MTQEAAARLTESREYQDAYGRLKRAITGGTRLLTSEEMEAIGGLVRATLAASPAPAMLAALEALLRVTSTIEVLGEWEALDVNARLRRSEREKVDAILDRAAAAIAQARGEKVQG